MKPFEYAAPKTLKEAAELLSDSWGRTEVLAGGTDLVTALKQGITGPDRVVSLREVAGLRGIKATKKSVRIGAMTTLGELAEHNSVREHFPALVTAAEGVGSPQLWAAGTVGGDLCQRPRCWYYRNGYGLLARHDGASLARDGDNRYHAIFGNDGAAVFVSASSLGPALIALGAEIIVTGPGGKSRELAAAEFFRTPKTDAERETALQPNEILTAIEVPLKGLKNATYEVRHRHGLDWPYVTASVAMTVKGGVISDAKVALGHVAPVPWLSGNAAQALNGSSAEPATAARAGDAAAQGAKPLSGNAYKVQMVRAAVKRAVQAAAC